MHVRTIVGELMATSMGYIAYKDQAPAQLSTAPDFSPHPRWTLLQSGMVFV